MKMRVLPLFQWILRDTKSRSTEPRMMSAQHEACTAHAFPKSFAGLARPLSIRPRLLTWPCSFLLTPFNVPLNSMNGTFRSRIPRTGAAI